MPTKLKSLQACRGLAALLVLLFHATEVSRVYLKYDLLHGIFLFGYSGVDFFFVLSGFIIFWVHRRDVGHPEVLKPYFRKRFIRIYPLYWFVFVVLLPIYFGVPRNFRDCLILLKSFLLLPQASNPLVTVAWSLSSELFFYGLFGLAIYLPWKRTRPLFLLLLLVTTVFYSAKLLNHGTFHMSPHTGFVFSSYNLEFAMGCLAAYLARRLRPNGCRWLAVIGLMCFLICGLNENLLYAHFRQQHAILAYGLPSMLLVWGAVQWEQSAGKMIPPFLLLLGDASYSIYLTHYALLDLVVRGSIALEIVAWAGQTLVISMTIALTITIGVLFHMFIEKPLLSCLRKLGKDGYPATHQPAPVGSVPEGTCG
ncbi:MAG: acyltransferase family protein [Pyrinomonadaceae bacterium]